MTPRLLRGIAGIVGLMALGAALAACQPAPEPYYERRLLTFGTLVDISLWGVEEETAERAFQTLEADFSYMNDTWHAWRPSSLSRVNQLLETGGRFSAGPSVLPLIELSTGL